MKKLSDYLYYEEKNPDLKIYCGDCLEILPLLDKVDTVITDPPYGIDLKPQRQLTESIENDTRELAEKLWKEFTPLIYSLTPDNSAHIIFASFLDPWSKEILDKYFKVKNAIAWIKNNFGIGYYLRPQWEIAWYLHKGKPEPPKNPISNVWDFRKIQIPIHSCQKPTALLFKAIEFCGGNSVLDPFLGSGTTLVACKELNRKGIGIEISEKYCAIAKNRLQNTMRSLF